MEKQCLFHWRARRSAGFSKQGFCLFAPLFLLLSPPTCAEFSRFMANAFWGFWKEILEMWSAGGRIKEADVWWQMHPWISWVVLTNKVNVCCEDCASAAAAGSCFHTETAECKRTWHKLNTSSSYRSQRHPIRLQLIPARPRLHHSR